MLKKRIEHLDRPRPISGVKLADKLRHFDFDLRALLFL